MEAPTADQALARLGGVSAVLGAALGLVVNLLHGDLPDDAEAALTRVASTPSWGLLHLGIIVSVVLVLGGLAALSQATHGPASKALRHLAMVIALPGGAVMIVGIAIDGFASKELADVWLAALAPEKASAFRMAVAMEAIQNALFHVWAALFMGVPFALMGMAGLLPGSGEPRWLSAIALVGGAGSLFMGTTGYAGIVVPGILFNVFVSFVTLWLLVAGVRLWRTTSPAASPSV